jgi:Fe2+ or Zn2+ uptake regulation protein
MQKKNIASIGFMAPSKVNEFEVKHQPNTTIAAIYRTLNKFHDKDLILLP